MIKNNNVFFTNLGRNKMALSLVKNPTDGKEHASKPMGTMGNTSIVITVLW